MITILIIILILLIILFVFPLGKTKRPEEFNIFKGKLIAHRGVYNNIDIIENSIPAFIKAIENNYAIETDLQLTKDNKVVVFHDDKLTRICGIDKYVDELTLDEIKKLSLLNTNETIPTLKEFLSLVDGKVPLCLEIKSHGDNIRTCVESTILLNEYKGFYSIQSFNPFVVRWFIKNKPNILRGQLASNFFKSKNKIISTLSPSHLIFNIISKPDFIAYNYYQTNNIFFKYLKLFTNLKLQVWAIKTQEELDKDNTKYDMVLFDKFEPKLK